MKLRWLIICNEHGFKYEPVLQMWDKESSTWIGIPIVECKSYEIDECEATEDW